MRVDKTLSELWHLRGNTDKQVSREEYEEEVKETAYMSINTIKKLQRRISELELEKDDWKQSHDKVARALEKSEQDHQETMELLHDANRDIKEWERISNKQVEHLTRNGKEIINMTEAYFDTIVYLSTLEDIAAVHKAIKEIIEDK